MTKAAIKSVEIMDFDFLDFGASKAESIEFGKKHFDAKRGLGIDLDPERVKAMNQAGYDCMVGDLTNLNLPENCVKFVKMSHILEHMPNLDGVYKAVDSAKHAATDFLVITGPYFDQDKYLTSQGFKLHWSDYPEHTCHLTIEQLAKVLKDLKLDNYELYVRYPITNSDHEHIHPLTSPSGSHRYDAKLHPPKKQKLFDRLIWTDFVCYVRQKPKIKNWQKITQAYRHPIPFIEVNSGKRYDWPTEVITKFIELTYLNQELESQIHDLKQIDKKRQEKINQLTKQLKDIESSKAWGLTRRLQKVTKKVRQPIKSKP